MTEPPELERTPPPARPKRPANLPHGRWLDDFPDLSAAELELVEYCAKGRVWVPDDSNGERPAEDEKTEANTIRAELIRFLALGGDATHSVHEEGVMLRGTWIAGELSLHQCTAPVRLDLKQCRFDAEPILTAATLPELALNGSAVPSLGADRMIVAGGVFLGDGFEAQGEVRLLGAEIGGDLACSGGTFSNKDGNALSAELMKVAGNVCLGDRFEAQGEVRLNGAEIGGNLDCSGGTFSNQDGNALVADGLKVAGSVFLTIGFEAQGEARLPSAEIGGDLTCSGGTFSNSGDLALLFQGLSATGALFLRDATIDGTIDLAAAQIGTLIDDVPCWQAGGHVLDGLHYDRIVGPMDAQTRIAWLQTQRDGHLDHRDFRPQPWEQLIKVLREMGHAGEAAEVAMAKQDAMRNAGLVKGPLRRPLHWLYGTMAGYGYRPLRVFFTMFCVFLAGAFFFQVGADYGYIGPTSPLLTSPDIAESVTDTCGHAHEQGKKAWTDCPAMPPEYSIFQPLVYSADIILPLVDLQQEADWSPIVENSHGDTLGYGTFLRWLMWFEILFGWVASLMLVAILGRLVDRD